MVLLCAPCIYYENRSAGISLPGAWGCPPTLSPFSSNSGCAPAHSNFEVSHIFTSIKEYATVETRIEDLKILK
jgi:hypothetical protein